MKQINLKNVLTLLMLMIVVLFTTNCKSSKQVAQTSDQKIKSAVVDDEVEIKKFCTESDYQSNDNFIRARGIGQSTDYVMSEKVAKANTLEALGSQIEVSVKAFMENYNNRRERNMDESVEKRFEDLIQTVVNQKITGYKKICDKSTKTGDGKYRTYYVFELPVDNVLNPIYTSISHDNELKVDYDYQKFRKEAIKEIKKAKTEKTE